MLSERDPSSPQLDYCPAGPQYPWQLTFMVIATLVCAGTLLAGMLMYGYRQIVGPTPPPPPATQPVAAAAVTEE